MKYLVVLSLCLTSINSWAQMGLAEVLSLQNNHLSLDALTRSPETMNKSTLLHLGKNSNPVRHELIANAKKYVFITVPYWFKDETGVSMLNEIKNLKNKKPNVDVKVMVDWTSPASTKDFLGVNFYNDLSTSLGSDNVIQWNKLWNFDNYSFKVWKNRIHDKVFVVDGEKMIMGGMNMGDDYLLGGASSKGWHDTDILFEGPVAQQGAQIFLKPFLFEHHVNEIFSDFSNDDRIELKILQYLFYYNHDSIPYRSEGWLTKAKSFEVPLSTYLKNSNYFPKMNEADPAYDTPVRLIYDNPLVDRQMVPYPKRKGVYVAEQFSKFLNTLDFILPNVKESMRLFIPYLTISDRMTDILIQTAKRGVKVEIITNSLKSHDLGSFNYKASLPRVKELEDAGVTVYEWQGHKDLFEFEKNNNCMIDGYWPGRTLHTKMIVLDREVAFLGSHNMNVRSEKHNSEIMALIRSPKIASQLYDIFEYDLDKGQRELKCGDKLFTNRPPRTKRADIPGLLKNYNFKKLEKLKKLYDLL